MSDDVRTPPHDITAEQSVLGGMLLSRQAIAAAVDIVQVGDFYRPAHQTIFEAITYLFSHGEPVDAITVNAHLTEAGQITRVGGAPYLHTLAETIPTAANTGYYARIVADRAVLRRLVEAGTSVAQLGYGGDGDVEELVDRAQAEIYDAVQSRTEGQRSWDFIGAHLFTAVDEIQAAAERGNALTGVPTGFADLDGLLGGLHPQQMVIVAARPSLGKSTLALDVARHAAMEANHTVAFFNLEMGLSEVSHRMMSAEGKVPLQEIRTGSLDDAGWERIGRITRKIADAPLIVDDSASVSVAEIAARCRQIQQQHGLELVVIDYLQLLKTRARGENRQVEVSDMSRQLKLLAKELDVPVVVLAQLNRNAEYRESKRPQLSDLRESGAIEQDADVVILLHREDAYDKDSPRAGEADLIVAKHRNGPTATITTIFQGHYSRFVNMAPS
ncbi:replicative DNA helicase [Halostreptopolyspora alba]